MAKEIVELKKGNNSLAKEVESSKSKDKKAMTESRKFTNETKELNDKIKAFLTKENHCLKSVENKLKVANKERKKMAEIESQSKKATEENNLLRAYLAKEKAAIDKFYDRIKMKDEEIRSLTLTKRISVGNATKLQKNNQQL